MISTLTTQGNIYIEYCFGVVFAFAMVYLMLRNHSDILPRDQGREFAVNGALSQGKPRGAGIIFVPSFILAALMFDEMNLEKLIYLVLIAVEMATGYFDDKSETPWGELKKGLLDLAVAIAAAITVMHFNGTEVHLQMFDVTFTIPPVLYVILAIVLIWVSINVTNCTDGVDGLSGTLTIVTLASFLLIDTPGAMNYEVMLFIVCLIAYLWYNAHPSLVLMGDAGSRAMGIFIAIVAMKSSSPFMYIPFALIMIFDGGAGLVKVSFIRYLHLKNFMRDIKTPLHDHARKNASWSDEQTVTRFAILQMMISLIAIYFAKA